VQKSFEGSNRLLFDFRFQDKILPKIFNIQGKKLEKKQKFVKTIKNWTIKNWISTRNNKEIGIKTISGTLFSRELSLCSAKAKGRDQQQVPALLFPETI
jgi:hypothetical protein